MPPSAAAPAVLRRPNATRIAALVHHQNNKKRSILHSSISQSGRLGIVTSAVAVAETASAEADIAPAAAAAQGGDGQGPRAPSAPDRPITVGTRPAANALLRRLEVAPQTLVRAAARSDAGAYRVLSTIASAQCSFPGAPSRALLYVPFTKSSAFTALVLPTSVAAIGASGEVAAASGEGSPSSAALIVNATTDPDSLASTLRRELVRGGNAVLASAGAAASARAAAALVAVRAALLPRGYEVGVVPRFVEQVSGDDVITLLQQQVVLQELPTARVTLPGAGSKSLEPSATAAAALLARQSRVAVHVPQGRLEAVTPFLNMLLTPPGSPAQPKLPEQQKQQQHQQQQEGRSEGSTPPQPRQRSARDNKRRLLLAWPPSTADQLLESLDQLSSFASVPLEPLAMSGALPAAVPTSEPQLQLQLRPSRLSVLPSPATGRSRGGGSGGGRDDWRPVVATADSAAAGLAGALEARVARVGAAWLRSDGSAAGNAVAWEALAVASSKVDAQDGAGGMLALVDVGPGRSVGTAAGAAAAAPPPLALRLLVVRDSDIARSILQSPNTPLDVSVSGDLWRLLKLSTALNSFLPLSPAGCAGGLLLLPAVLPVPQADVAADYRFAAAPSGRVAVPYSIRLQRCAGRLPKGEEGRDGGVALRVSLSTDPTKLRDAIVAKALQREPAALRFVGAAGRAPPLLTVAMAAVAAARVRLQQKGAGLDIGVMPFAEALTAAQASSAAEATSEGDGVTASAAAAGAAAVGSQQRDARRAPRRGGGGSGGAGGGSGSSSSRTVYSLRIVPLPAAAPASPAEDVVADSA